MKSYISQGPDRNSTWFKNNKDWLKKCEKILKEPIKDTDVLKMQETGMLVPLLSLHGKRRKEHYQSPVRQGLTHVKEAARNKL